MMIDAEGKPCPSPFDRVRLLPDPKTPSDLPPFTEFVKEEEGELSFYQTLPRQEPVDGKPAEAHGDDRFVELKVRLNTSIFSKKRLRVNGLWSEMASLERALPKTESFLGVVELREGLASGYSEEALAEPTHEGIQLVSARSLEEWKSFWDCSGVALEDRELEECWYRNLYFFNRSVREGVTCPGLFANWSFGDIGTPWHGDYHMNYNTQQPFWLPFSSNHLDKHLPYVEMVHHLLPVSRNWAQEYYKMRGAFFPHSAYPVKMNMQPYPLPTWGWEVFETPWTVQSLWWHYTYSQDLSFLKEKAFGPIRDAVLFLVDYMQRPEAHGAQWGDDAYHIFPTVPPELYGLSLNFNRNADGLLDLVLTKFVFAAFREACELLDLKDEESDTLERISEILSHFPDYPKADTESGTVFVSVQGEEPGVVYNCPANTMTIFPGEEKGLHSTKEEYDLARRSLEYQENEGGNELVFLNLQAARLGALDLDRFKRQVRYCKLPNGTCTDKVLQSKGRYQDTTAFDWMAPHGVWFENFALPVVINECMMQSYTGVIRLFPNWQKDCDAAFENLRAVGAFLVSCSLKGGDIEHLEIFSETGGRCRVILPWKGSGLKVLCEGEEVFVSKEEMKESVGGDLVFSFETEKGQSYLLELV